VIRLLTDKPRRRALVGWTEGRKKTQRKKKAYLVYPRESQKASVSRLGHKKLGGRWPLKGQYGNIFEKKNFGGKRRKSIIIPHHPGDPRRLV